MGKSWFIFVFVLVGFASCLFHQVAAMRNFQTQHKPATKIYVPERLFGASEVIVTDLTGDSWVLSNSSDFEAPSTVPGSATMDLLSNDVIYEPYYRYGDTDLRWVALSDWKFTLSDFTLDDDASSKANSLMVFEGIDTAASIQLNGVSLGETNNMFRRYTFDVTQVLEEAGNNTLVVEIESAATYANAQAEAYPYDVPMSASDSQNGEPNRNFIRKEQCSFSWDWGPAFLPSGVRKCFF